LDFLALIIRVSKLGKPNLLQVSSDQFSSVLALRTPQKRAIASSFGINAEVNAGQVFPCTPGAQSENFLHLSSDNALTTQQD